MYPTKYKLLALTLLMLAVTTCPAFSQNGPQDFRNTPEYQSARRFYEDLGGTNLDEFDKRYAERMRINNRPRDASTMAEDIGNLPGALYDTVASSFKRFVGLDPDRPVSEQFGKRSQVYEPIKDYNKLTPARVNFYQRFMFTNRLQGVADSIGPAHERALVAIRQCDDSLLSQSLREIDFVIKEYEAVVVRAQEQIDMNNHQIAYYEQELFFLDSPQEDPRLQWNRSTLSGQKFTNLVEYLKLKEPLEVLQQKGPKQDQIFEDVHQRVAFIERWNKRIGEVQAYIQSSLPVMRENQQKIRQAYDSEACIRCQ